MKGTVIRRGTRWAVVIDLGRDPISGRRTRKWHSGFDSKREAERARIEILSRIQRGLYVEPNKLRFGEYLLAEWLPRYGADPASKHTSELRDEREESHCAARGVSATPKADSEPSQQPVRAPACDRQARSSWRTFVKNRPLHPYDHSQGPPRRGLSFGTPIPTYRCGR